jgi:positive regulator of sigma E activity
MLTKATVLNTEGNVALVEVERSSACEGCHKNESGEGCSVCTLTGGNRKFSAKALNKVGAVKGDKVEITSSSSRVLFYSALVFLLPVVVGLAFYFVAQRLLDAELYHYISLVCGFVLSFASVWIYSKKVGEKRFDIEIVRVLASGETEND